MAENFILSIRIKMRINAFILDKKDYNTGCIGAGFWIQVYRISKSICTL